MKKAFSKWNAFLQSKLAKLQIFKNWKILFIIPAVVIFVALLEGTIFQLSGTRGFANIGVDFQGGTRLTVEMEGDALNTKANVKAITDIIEEKGFTLSGDPQTSGENSLIFKYSNILNANNAAQKEDLGTTGNMEKLNTLNSEIRDEIKAELLRGNVTKVEVTDSAVGNETSMRLLRSGLIATAVALAVMLLYIIIRFDFYSGLAAVIALFHDVLIMLAFTVIFRIEINSTIVAAVITIVAYSINNTIVVFDRIRDKVKPLKKQNRRVVITDVIDPSIKETITRTIYTTLTTLITIVLLAALGVSAVRIFALPIIFGLVGGFYSSICMAAPLWGLLYQLKEKLANDKNKKKVHTITKRSKAKKA